MITIDTNVSVEGSPHISVNHPELLELHYIAYASRSDPQPHSCTICAAMGAYYLSRIKKTVAIIETDKHTVVWDGLDTWDFHLGIVFREYRYPSPNPPEFELIPDWTCVNIKNYIDYYSDDALSQTKNFKLVKVQR